jgi:hypothetical protein
MELNVKLPPDEAKMIYQSLDASPIQGPLVKRQAATVQEAIEAAAQEAQATENAEAEAWVEAEAEDAAR